MPLTFHSSFPFLSSHSSTFQCFSYQWKRTKEERDINGVGHGDFAQREAPSAYVCVSTQGINDLYHSLNTTLRRDEITEREPVIVLLHFCICLFQSTSSHLGTQSAFQSRKQRMIHDKFFMRTPPPFPSRKWQKSFVGQNESRKKFTHDFCCREKLSVQRCGNQSYRSPLITK